jgi:uncharacterized protein DUF938
MDDDARLCSQAAERNGPPILVELQRLLPAKGLMLEIASGTGQHAALLCRGLPGWQWLRARDPSWGLRRVAEVATAAEAAGLRLRERVAMPSNNLLLVWSLTAAGGAA